MKEFKSTKESINIDETKHFTILMKFTLPVKMVWQEYYIMSGMTLVGIVGGTLGMFVGFSFIDSLSSGNL